MGEIKDSLSQISGTLYNITHPMEALKNLGTALLDEAFFITMIFCMVGIVLYLIGWNRGKKIAIGSFLVYFVISMIRAGW